MVSPFVAFARCAPSRAFGDRLGARPPLARHMHAGTLDNMTCVLAALAPHPCRVRGPIAGFAVHHRGAGR